MPYLLRCCKIDALVILQIIMCNKGFGWIRKCLQSQPWCLGRTWATSTELLCYWFTHDWHVYAEEEQELGMTVMGVWQPVPPVSSAPMPPPPRSLSEELFPAHWHVDVYNGDGWWLALPHRGTDGLLPKRLSASLHQSRWQSPPTPHPWKRAQAQYLIEAQVCGCTLPKLYETCYFHVNTDWITEFSNVIHTFSKKNPEVQQFCQIWAQHPELYFHPMSC